ncbi:TIGR03089 family protein [Gordonia sp. CPCC 205515]|uniref:TIGR03089 family protein n=1 Tax=Gordonia sp. CPCC 205515 TaxID=3140791 RepID=UPI003AF37CF4
MTTSAPVPASVTTGIFGAVADWSQPMVTYYDHDSGERTELSAATLGNWAAKSANFFVDELGLAPGDELRVDLPEHWQTIAILLGAWWAGAHVRLDDDTDTAAVAAVITSADRIDAYGDVDELLVASLDPFAMGVRDLPIGVTDFASAVRVHGDQYALRSPVTGPVLDGQPVGAVLAAARTAAEAEGIVAGARALSVRSWRTGADVQTNLLAPLIVGASLVTVSHADATRLDALADTERATVTLR